MYGVSLTVLAILGAVVAATAANHRAVGQAVARLGGAATTVVLVSPLAIFTHKGSALRGSAGSAVAKIFRELGEIAQELVVGLVKAVAIVLKHIFKGSKWAATKIGGRRKCKQQCS